MQQVTGHCGKCGAPYMQETGPWHGIVPPPITPTCQCWNVATPVTTTYDGTKVRETTLRTNNYWHTTYFGDPERDGRRSVHFREDTGEGVHWRHVGWLMPDATEGQNK